MTAAAKRPYRSPEQMLVLKADINARLKSDGHLKPMAMEHGDDGLSLRQRYNYFLTIAHKLGWKKYFLTPEEWAEVKRRRA